LFSSHIIQHTDKIESCRIYINNIQNVIRVTMKIYIRNYDAIINARRVIYDTLNYEYSDISLCTPFMVPTSGIASGGRGQSLP
jgi:hypothetical protein